MSKPLKTADQLATHVKNFKGVSTERKKQIADHLVALPTEHHAAVSTILTAEHDDPESKFVLGCFGEPEPATPTPELPPAA